VLELLQNKSTLVQIASKHNILPQNLQNWKKTFLANAEYNYEQTDPTFLTPKPSQIV
jgi:putative transposase